MQLTLVGHACWLFESEGTRLLTDPVLSDPFEDDTVQTCPARQVDLDRLPPPDALFLSHRHPDHFHPDSLRRLPRDLPVFIPPDPMMGAALHQLGFSRLVPLHAWQQHQLGALQLMATPTAGDFPECGLVVQDAVSTAFDQVDTPLNRETVDRLRQQLPTLDLHLAMHASQAFGWFDGVPEDLATTHGRNLSVARALAARVVVPAAAGFRFVDAFDWLNQQLFPITEDRFIRDMARLCPDQQVLAMRPGDQLVLGEGPARHLPGAADFVRALEPDLSRIRPDRAAPVPPVEDDDPDGIGAAALAPRVHALVQQGLLPALQAAWSDDPLVGALRSDQVRYHLRAVLPDGDQLDWTLDLSGDAPVLRPGDVAEGAELSRTVAASALLAVAEGQRSCFYLRVRSRRSQVVLSIDLRPDGLAVDQPNVPDLLSWFLLRHRAAVAGESGVLRYYGLA